MQHSVISIDGETPRGRQRHWRCRGAVCATVFVIAATAGTEVMAIPPPPEPPYPFLIPGGPRAAWIETLGGDRWLPVSSIEKEWCPGLGQACVPNSHPGTPPPGGVCAIDRDRRPTVRLLPGEQVKFHIPVSAPTRVTLTIGGMRYELGTGTTPAWDANSTGGPATLSVESQMGQVHYRAWLAITKDKRPARIRRRPTPAATSLGTRRPSQFVRLSGRTCPLR